MSNIIFVDIDGVLLPGKMHLFNHNREVVKKYLANDYSEFPTFDSVAVRMFNLWAKYSKAKIVLITTWALRGDDSFAYTKEAMKYNGLNFDYHDNALVPRNFRIHKLNSLGMWIEEYVEDGNNLLVVDDDSGLSYYESAMPHWKKYSKKDFSVSLINPEYNDGLTWNDFKYGCDALNIDYSELLEKEFGVKKLPPLTDRERKILTAFF